MTLFRRLGIALTALTLGAVMTTPTAPSEGQAITDLIVSPLVARIGIVTDIVESDNITVKISGSPVLVQASYLFPQYLPVLGDIVYVTKQDAQWFVLGTMSGPINSVAMNPSFENGTVGATPTDWTINVISSGGGVPTFTKIPVGNKNGISGLFLADFGVDSTVAGASLADVFSTPLPANDLSQWTAAIWIESAFIDNDAVTFANNGGFSVFTLYVQFLDSGFGLLTEYTVNSLGLSTDLNSPRYLRPSPGTGSYTAPVNTSFVRLKLRGDFTMSANSFTSFFVDYAILRQVQ